MYLLSGFPFIRAVERVWCGAGVLGKLGNNGRVREAQGSHGVPAGRGICRER